MVKASRNWLLIYSGFRWSTAPVLPTTEYTLCYHEKETEIVENRAETADMEVGEFIKFISMHTVEDYSFYKNTIDELTKENKELKAKMSFYTEDVAGGIFLDINNDTIDDIFDMMKEFNRNFTSVEDYIVYASTNLNRLLVKVVGTCLMETEKVLLKKK